MIRKSVLWCVTCALAGSLSVGCKGGDADGVGGRGGSGGSGASGGSGGSDLPFEGEVGNLVEALRNADFVFEGEVTTVVYANATNNGTGGPDPDEDNTPDSAALPHTFVTYRIMEDFSGNAQDETVTMRFLGGVDETSGPDYDIYELAQSPQHDVGDRDIVFMRRNGDNACPLVDCANGRFRVLQSPDDDRPYVFTELGQEVRLIEDSASAGRLFMVGEHAIPEILSQTIAFPDDTTQQFIIESVDEDPEQDPVPTSRTVKHDFDPRPDGTSPKDEPGEAFDAPVAGSRLEPAAFRALVRKAIADHPDFAWLPYANADPEVPFEVPMFRDVAGPSNDDDPRVERPRRTPAEQAEAAAVEAADLENDGFFDPAVAFDIAMRRQTETGIIETPNEEDADSRAEDMWTGRSQ